MGEKEVPRLDRSAFSVVDLAESNSDMEYWLSRSPEERLASVELCRRMVYGHDFATS